MNRVSHWAVRGAFALLMGGALLAAAPLQDSPSTGVKAIALVVHADNPLRDVKFSDVRGLLRLDRKFWPNSKKTRVVLVLPPPESQAKRMLNERVYRMEERRLRKYWTGKLFAGDISTLPRKAKTLAAVGSMVGSSKGAISAVPADDVPAGVRVLKIDGRAPGEKGYPLNIAPGSAQLDVSALN